MPATVPTGTVPTGTGAGPAGRDRAGRARGAGRPPDRAGPAMRIVRVANYVAPASGGLRTALRELGAG